jgi:hypothetical protein
MGGVNDEPILLWVTAAYFLSAPSGCPFIGIDYDCPHAYANADAGYRWVLNGTTFSTALSTFF